MAQCLKAARFGPDILSTHWMLHFRFMKRRFIYPKFGGHGKNLDVRPFATAISTRNIFLGDNITIRPFTILNATNSTIIIEDDVLIAPNVYITVTQHNYKGRGQSIREQGHSFEPVNLKKGAWIGFGAIILQGVTIGENAVVGAGAVVTRDIPADTMYGGVPAREIQAPAN